MRALAPYLAVVLALGCGGFENAPLLTGKLRGQVEGADAAAGLVAVMGKQHLRARIEAGGAFELTEVPVGTQELFVVASKSRAARLSVEVRGGRYTELGAIATTAAAFAEVRVAASGGQRLKGATLSVEATPYQGLSLSDSGEARVGPLPAGCYRFEAAVPGLRSASAEACLSAGEDREVLLAVTAPDPSSPGGCAVTGCQEGLTCAADGSCVECLTSQQCGNGLSCEQGKCVGSLPACVACTADWQCGQGKCLALDSGELACVEPCGDSGICSVSGFVCLEGGCVPNPAQLGGCYAYNAVGSPCSSDGACRSRGLLNGVCALSACTFECSETVECPEGSSCGDRGGRKVCVRD